MVESSIVLHNKKIIDYNIGNPCSVKFNFERIWKYYHNNIVLNYEMRFIHIHPSGFLQLSELDENCMKGFYQAFNIPIIFHIIVFENNCLFSDKHEDKCYKYENNKIIKENYIIKNIDSILLFLKYLSYGENK